MVSTRSPTNWSEIHSKFLTVHDAVKVYIKVVLPHQNGCSVPTFKISSECMAKYV